LKKNRGFGVGKKRKWWTGVRKGPRKFWKPTTRLKGDGVNHISITQKTEKKKQGISGSEEGVIKLKLFGGLPRTSGPRPTEGGKND